MVSDYKKLATTALRVTVDTPLLWFFGLFLSAGFNFNWLYLFKGGITGPASKIFAHMRDQPFREMPHGFTTTLFLLLAGIIVVWVVTNWVKIIFILHTADLLKAKRLGEVPGEISLWQNQKKLFRQSRKMIIPVAALSLFTVVAQGIVTFVLAGPWLWEKYIAPLPGMVILATMLFVIFMLFFSLLNFFAALYVSLYGKSINEAISASTRLIKGKARPLAGACFVLLVLYSLGLFVGIEAISEIRALFLLWLGFLNAFFNVGLFVFFQTYVRPTEFEEKETSKSGLILKVSVDKTL